jgi:hypothetical protein
VASPLHISFARNLGKANKRLEESDKVNEGNIFKGSDYVVNVFPVSNAFFFERRFIRTSRIARLFERHVAS